MLNLFNENCSDMLTKLEDKSVDLCLTDLPYGILTNKKEADYQNENRNFCDWDFEIDYDKVLPELKRVMKDKAPIVLFAKFPFTYKLYEQMIKHGFKFQYNWIWKKNAIANFASMKYRPGNNYEEVMVFSKGNKKVNYYSGAVFNGEVKTKCNFYNYNTRTPISSEEVFDKYIIPFIQGNSFDKDRINILPNNRQIVNTGDHIGFAGIQLKEILNEDIRIPDVGSRGGSKMSSANSTATMLGIKLDEIFKEKYGDQFEIDLENKILYRTVKSYTNFPTSIIDIKYKNSGDKGVKKHPTSKPVEVLEYLLDRYTEEGDTVLDFTMGSGSTGVACKNKNRNFIGCEISKTWFEVANLRIGEK